MKVPIKTLIVARIFNKKEYNYPDFNISNGCINHDKYKEDPNKQTDNDYKGHENGHENGHQTDDIHKTYMPKHLLPLAGRPLIHHLMEHCVGVGMEKIVIAIGAADDVTKDSLLQMGCTCTALPPSALLPTSTDTATADAIAVASADDIAAVRVTADATTIPSITTTNATTATKTKTVEEIDSKEEEMEQIKVPHPTSELKYGDAEITIISLPDNCSGSAEAMRCIIAANIIDKTSHVMVLPADLVLYGDLATDIHTDAHVHAQSQSQSQPQSTVNHSQSQSHNKINDALGSLADVHRREYRVGIEKGMPLAMTMLLADVGEEDEKGVPLKESAKVSISVIIERNGTRTVLPTLLVLLIMLILILMPILMLITITITIRL